MDFASTYSTHKEVKLLDRKLGILYITCICLVLGYVVGVRLIIEKGYSATEKAYGVVGVRLNGTALFKDADGVPIPYDVASLSPTIEGDAVFIPTRIIRANEQTMGNCTDPDEPCTTDSDCVAAPPLEPGLCTNGHCQQQQWCNSGGTTGQPADPFTDQTNALAASEETMQASSFTSLRLVLISTIQFPDLGKSVLSTEDQRSAKYRWNMTQILQRARLEEDAAIQSGAVLSVTLQWDCHNLFNESACQPHLVMRQLAEGQPYLKSWANYYRRGNGASTLLRDEHQARGLRLLVRAQGTGERIDALQIVTQFFVALALFPIAAYLADGIMQNVFSERRHYREYKTELSPDFSDVRAKVEQLEKQSQSQQAKAMNYAV